MPDQAQYPQLALRRRSGIGVIALTLGLLVTISSGLQAQTVKGSRLEPFLAQHCFDCHSGEEPAAALDLKAFSIVLRSGEVRRRWAYLYDRVADGEMPPKSAAQPTGDERQAFLKTVSAALTRSDKLDREVTLRRLNRREYANTVNDLFGIEVDVSRTLLDDSRQSGFDTTGSVLSVSAEQMELYVKAADLVLDQVFGPASKPKTIKRSFSIKELRARNRIDRFTDEGGILFGKRPLPAWESAVRSPGRYRVRIRAKAVQSKTPVVMRVNGGLTGNIASHVSGFFEVPPGELTTIEFIDRAREFSDCYQMSFDKGFPFWKLDAESYQGPGLLIKDIEVEGPIDAWPPKSRRQLLDGTDPDKGGLDDIRRILNNILPRAFRRPILDDDVQIYLSLAKSALDEGLGFEKSLRRALKGVLCSPDFLFLEEAALPPQRTPGAPPATIDQHALASRLSYFLWSSMPDRTLLALAKSGELKNPQVLRGQVERMLADPKSKRFVSSFTGQWLRLNDIDFTVPSRTHYPEYNQLLRKSMLDESHGFFREVLDKDLSVQNFIDSDFVMINQPLAEFYGITGVQGLHIRRVQLPANSVRGGVLTQASVLKVSADGTRTSPVLRGVWILKHLFGAPSPPPPPSVSAVEPDIRGATTIREQLAKHRSDDSCNRCHRKIDPPGFALESFDVIGAERTWYRTKDGRYYKKKRHPYSTANVLYRKGPDVDSSGETASGRKFDGIREYKKILLEDEQALPKSLARLLLTYAIGRDLGFSDRPDVARIVAAARPNRYGLKSLIHAVVQSKAFAAP